MAFKAGKENFMWGKFGKENPFFGKKHTEETKQKIRMMRIGKKASEATKKKLSLMRKGSDNNNWRGGKYTNLAGYVFIHSPNHPFADCRNYVTRSRLVMEKHLGRYLKPKEISHHKNGIKNDDRIENLQLCSNQSEHVKFHMGEGHRLVSVVK